MGVVFFFINAAFATILLLMVLFATAFAIFMRQPDSRYQPMRDDRGSFIKSQNNLNTELDALGATARGDMTQMAYKGRDLDDDDSFSSGSGRHSQNPAGVPLPPSTAVSTHRSPSRGRTPGDPPRSPIDASMPLFPSAGTSRHGTPEQYSDSSSHAYNGYSNTGMNPQYGQPYSRGGSAQSNTAFRQQNNSSPWQRGAGYDH